MVFITVSWTISEKRSAIFLKTVIFSNVLLSKAMEATSSAGWIKYVWSRHVFFCRTFFSARLKKTAIRGRFQLGRWAGMITAWAVGRNYLYVARRIWGFFNQNDPKNVFVPKTIFVLKHRKKMNLVLISCPKTVDHFYWFQEILSLTKQSAANMSMIQRSC